MTHRNYGLIPIASLGTGAHRMKLLSVHRRTPSGWEPMPLQAPCGLMPGQRLLLWAAIAWGFVAAVVGLVEWAR